MDRLEFIKHSWLAYPSPEKIPQGAVCGRVQAITSESLQLQGTQVQTTVLVSQVVEGNDPQLGVTCAWAHLRVGDWLAWLPESQHLFLLSPCLVDNPKLKSGEAQQWSAFLTKVEQFFVDQGYLHLRTPFLVPSPGVDHHIDFLKVEASRTKRRWTLPTSPEIHLKKFLCQGYQKIFEIKNCFRDDLPGPQHKVEFTMIEWYQSFASLDDIIADIRKLLTELTGQTLDMEVCSLAQVFKEKTGYDLRPNTTRAELSGWAQALGIETSADDDWNDLFFRLFMEKVEPQLGQDRPIVLKNFPAQQASLAQIDEQGWAQRFELYWRGVELANAYLEVNNPEENRVRFTHEESLRQQAGGDVAPLDQDYFQCLELGMPPASGIAMGLDRLYSVLNNRDRLS